MVDYDYTNRYHVDYLFRNLYYRDITDYKGLGLITWDVYEILMTQLSLTAEEQQLMKHIAAGYEPADFTFEMFDCYQRVVMKFVDYHIQ